MTNNRALSYTGLGFENTQKIVPLRSFHRSCRLKRRTLLIHFERYLVSSFLLYLPAVTQLDGGFYTRLIVPILKPHGSNCQNGRRGFSGLRRRLHHHWPDTESASTPNSSQDRNGERSLDDPGGVRAECVIFRVSQPAFILNPTFSLRHHRPHWVEMMSPSPSTSCSYRREHVLDAIGLD